MTKEEIMMKHCSDNGLLSMNLGRSILAAMEEYSEQNCDQIQNLFTRPTKELKPLEDLYRKENPHPEGKFYLPDTTKFYKWIRIKILGK